MAKALSQDQLERVYHHVFLPSKLPHASDEGSDIDLNLLRLTTEALSALPPLLSGNEAAAISKAITAIKNLKAVILVHGGISESELFRILDSLADGQSVPVLIREQNAAVIATREQERLVFETFELSPSNEAVVTTKGRLVRCFPGPAVCLDTRSHPGLLQVIAQTLTSLSHGVVPEMQPTIVKAGATHKELRDTTIPAAVTEFVVRFLQPLGEAASVSSISKNTRDEVLWTNALAPWRRSPMWLLIKVTLHLLLSRSSNGSERMFKRVMLFIHSHITDLIISLAPDLAVQSDCIYVMSAKIVRRTRKLRPSGSSTSHHLDKLLAHADGIVRRASGILSERWRQVRNQDSQPLDLEKLAKLDTAQDTYMPLPLLDKYISSMEKRPNSDVSKGVTPIASLAQCDAATLPTLSEKDCTDYHRMTANLQHFERWVSQNVDSWLESHVSNACLKLQDTLIRYHGLANVHYAGNPEGLSIMLLTIFELWVACDNAAVHECQLLSDYAPDIPIDALQNLLLPRADQLERLMTLENYMQVRSSRSRKDSSNMLLSKNHANGFAARFFDASDTLKTLRTSIESAAGKSRENKHAEFDTMQAEYERLDLLFEGEDCKYETHIIDGEFDPPETEEIHMDRECLKCLYRKQRDSLKIEIHEWPLPQDPVEASVVVFELKVPHWYSSWRDCKTYLLQKVLHGKSDERQPSIKNALCNDPHLSSKYAAEQHLSRRICLLSENKLQVKTHYRMKGIATMVASDVCVANGARYQYYDALAGRFVGALKFDHDAVARSCTYTLPVPVLQDYIFRPARLPDGRPSNNYVSSQSSCPPTMPLEEYKELTSVPLGRHIQWANMLLQLAMPSVDFRKEATTLIFLQCIHQTGPPDGGILREAHGVLHSNTKAFDVVRNLGLAVERVKRNWESAQALSLFASMTTRVLPLNAKTRTACFSLLAKIRDIAMTWIHSLHELALNASTQSERSLFVSKGVEVALVCASTFDVDDKYMTEILSSASNASTLIQAAIVVQQGGSEQDWNDQYLGLLRFRFARLSHRCYKLLAGHHAALDNAIKCSWSAYIPCTTGWVTSPGNADHCVMAETQGLEGVTQPIQYNLLSGELLVDGLPVAHAPAEYHIQPLYQTLFGTAAIEVMPATSKGFRYSTKRSFQAHEVQLGMLDNPAQLIVQASHSRATIEIVPSVVFLDDFPEHFVQDFIHWYNFKSGNVEFRPASDPWNPSSSASWMLQKVRGMGWKLLKDGDAIVGLRTPSAKAIWGILNPLANARRLNCVLQTIDHSLRVEIPTLRLNFTLARGETRLISKEFPGEAVDEKQYLGTLIGFKNKLVLKAKNGDRRLLLAEAPVVYAAQGAHVSVSVHRKDTISTAHAISIGSVLGLVDNGDLGCKFYMAYLHALTSFCLPDPFTCTTGTEQALEILKSSAARSINHLSQTNVDILTLLAGLCPGRSYYPPDKRVMQSVIWNEKLSFLSQHARLRSSVQVILDKAKRGAFCHPKNAPRFPKLQNVDEHLQKRDSIRSSAFKVSRYGAEEHISHYDVEYDARDRKTSSRGDNVALMSAFMARGGSDLHWPVPTAGKMWNMLQGVGVVHGSEPFYKPYRYDGSLVLPKEFDNVLAHLPVHHHRLAACQAPGERYSVSIWLATMAFAEGADMEMLQVFAMFCKCPDLLQSRPPSAAKFDIAEGNTCTYALLEEVIYRCALEFESFPRSATPQMAGETYNIWQARRKNILMAARRDEVRRLVRALLGQWPCSDPAAPSDIDEYSRLQPKSAMKAAQAKFLLWYNNKLLQEYLDSIVFSLSSLTTRAVQGSIMTYEPAPQQLSPVGHCSLREIFAESLPKDIKTRPRLFPSGPNLTTVKQSEETFQPLEVLLQTLDQTAESRYEKSCASELRSSTEALRSLDQEQFISDIPTTKQLEEYRRQCEAYATTMYQGILASINGHPNSSTERALQHWPRLSPSLLLQQLAHDQRDELLEVWRNRIIEYGIALTALQRAGRLRHLHTALDKGDRNTQTVTTHRSSQAIDLLNELSNEDHVNWSPYEYPEYLLMEIESGIMIREVQQQIASEMRNPSVSGNAVMQLNMGEGKSSVIIPMVAAALADGSQLVRVVVAKPQSKQMAEMLISKFGGLLGRQIYYMPFSGSLQLTKPAAETMLDVLRQCRRTGGILLVQPEHILSFRLMAAECFIADNGTVGKTLMAIQDFFDEYSRDIVDECDENFSVRFELIYTMGTQQPIELSPVRWFLLQQVLDLVHNYAASVAKLLPSSVELHSGDAGTFPRVRLLRADGTKLLMLQVAADIRDNGLDGFRMHRQGETLRKAFCDYITVLDVDEETVQIVENSEFWESSKTSILLLRGVFAGGVLEFVLGQKRWRVDYGLTSRSPPTKLAVPYRAKDSPSLRSEFSHPDVVITLTSLCYYYEGLSNEDMFTAFAHLMKSDRADSNYQDWLKRAPGVPRSFRQLQRCQLEGPTAVHQSRISEPSPGKSCD
jgi:hypothetical protein